MYRLTCDVGNLIINALNSPFFILTKSTSTDIPILTGSIYTELKFVNAVFEVLIVSSIILSTSLAGMTVSLITRYAFDILSVTGLSFCLLEI